MSVVAVDKEVSQVDLDKNEEAPQEEEEDVLMRESPVSPDERRATTPPVTTPNTPTKRINSSKRLHEYHYHRHHHDEPKKSLTSSQEKAEEDFWYVPPLTAEEIAKKRATDPAWIQERLHYRKIINTFRQYSWYSNKKLNGSVDYLNSLPTSHQVLLYSYKKHLHNIRFCVHENQKLFLLFIREEAKLFVNQEEVYPTNAPTKVDKTAETDPTLPTNFDFEKLQSVLKQIVRDWSADGQKERELCYGPILDKMESLYGSTRNEEGLSPIKVLVPGAGLGRLSHELVNKGYDVEGNEFSLFMLFASNFLLNKCNGKDVYKCYPWIHQTTNVLNHEDQIREVTFPDIDPSQLPPKSRFSMTAGDFLDVYGSSDNTNAWDCIVTCFFIDCANNIIAYLERIYSCLKDGGRWINLGPLLYHYADMAEEKSIEPSFDFLLEIIKKMGFIVETSDLKVPTSYADNSKSMLSYTYNSVFLVCRKGSVVEN